MSSKRYVITAGDLGQRKVLLPAVGYYGMPIQSSCRDFGATKNPGHQIIVTQGSTMHMTDRESSHALMPAAVS